MNTAQHAPTPTTAPTPAAPAASRAAKTQAERMKDGARGVPYDQGAALFAAGGAPTPGPLKPVGPYQPPDTKVGPYTPDRRLPCDGGDCRPAPAPPQYVDLGTLAQETDGALHAIGAALDLLAPTLHSGASFALEFELMPPEGLGFRMKVAMEGSLRNYDPASKDHVAVAKRELKAKARVAVGFGANAKAAEFFSLDWATYLTGTAAVKAIGDSGYECMRALALMLEQWLVSKKKGKPGEPAAVAAMIFGSDFATRVLAGMGKAGTPTQDSVEGSLDVGLEAGFSVKTGADHPTASIKGQAGHRPGAEAHRPPARARAQRHLRLVRQVRLGRRAVREGGRQLRGRALLADPGGGLPSLDLKLTMAAEEVKKPELGLWLETAMRDDGLKALLKQLPQDPAKANQVITSFNTCGRGTAQVAQRVKTSLTGRAGVEIVWKSVDGVVKELVVNGLGEGEVSGEVPGMKVKARGRSFKASDNLPQ